MYRNLLIIFTLAFMSCSQSDFQFKNTIMIGDAFKIQSDLSMTQTQHIADDLEKHLVSIASFLTQPPKKKGAFTITLLEDTTKFQNYLKAVSPVKSQSGFYLPDRRELGILWQNKQAGLRTLKHEMFHAYFEDRFIQPPIWLNEGLAEYFESKSQKNFIGLFYSDKNESWVDTLRRLKKQDKISSISELFLKDWTNRHALSQEQYALSWSLCAFFMESKNEMVQVQFRNYLDRLYAKIAPQKAFEASFTDLDQLNKLWLEELNKQTKLDFLPF